jgi:hypothetical protein
VFCHFGEAFSSYSRRPAAVARQLDAIAGAGYHGIRFWDLLGYDPAWRGREVAPVGFVGHDKTTVAATPDYYSKLAAFLRECSARGLRVQWSRGDMQMLNRTQRQEHFDLLAVIAAQAGWGCVGLFEGLNEAWKNGESDPNELARFVARFRRVNPSVLTGLSCPENSSEDSTSLDRWSVGQDVYIVHGFRQGEPHDRIRHIFDIAYEARPRLRLGWQGEPGGPGRDTDDTESLCLMAAMALLSRQAWVYMSAFGVRWDGPIEKQPGFLEVARIPRLLPRNLMRYGTLAAADAPASLFDLKADGELRAETTRLDQAIDVKGRFTGLLYGASDRKRIRARRACRGDIVDPVSAERIPFALRTGEELVVRCKTGRILTGRTL